MEVSRNAKEVAIGVAALTFLLAFAVLQSIMPSFAIGFLCGYSGWGCTLMPLAAQIAERGVKYGFGMAMTGYVSGKASLFWAGVGVAVGAVAVA